MTSPTLDADIYFVRLVVRYMEMLALSEAFGHIAEVDELRAMVLETDHRALGLSARLLHDALKMGAADACEPPDMAIYDNARELLDRLLRERNKREEFNDRA